MAKSLSDLKKELSIQENRVKRFKDKGSSETIISKLEKSTDEIKSQIKSLESKSKKKSTPKKKNKTVIAGGMSKEDCMKMLEDMKRTYLKSESTKKKNISTGRAESDGTLKASASLENEADSLESKAESGQTITKKEQKAIQLNISNIVSTCTEMIKSQKDSEKMVRDLISRLNRVLEDVKTGRLSYEG
jgi:hypothetical protein|tara:strand:+ start:624 stop:1190 length:567 start_codon:yes stop_codon:yes gene_type:complete